jgi:hypothetical protein
MIHRTGKRATHKARKYATKMETKEEENKEEQEKYTEENVINKRKIEHSTYTKIGLD